MYVFVIVFDSTFVLNFEPELVAIDTFIQEGITFACLPLPVVSTLVSRNKLTELCGSNLFILITNNG